MEKQFLGITHPVPMWFLPLWKLIMCKRNMHCFDEVLSSDGSWCLYCDACGLTVNIESVIEE